MEIGYSQAERLVARCARGHITRGVGNISTAIAISIAYPPGPNGSNAPSTVSLYRAKHVVTNGHDYLGIQSNIEQEVLFPFSSYPLRHDLSFSLHSSVVHQPTTPAFSRVCARAPHATNERYANCFLDPFSPSNRAPTIIKIQRKRSVSP